MDKIRNILKFIDENNLYPATKVITGSPTNVEVMIENKKILMFCSNDYLGLTLWE